MSVLEWRPEQPMPPVHAMHGADKYHGPIAAGYDAKREQSPKWHAENALVADMLSDLPAGTAILDIPVGTGRFIPLYAEKGFRVLAADLSEDMLKQAAMKVPAGFEPNIQFGVGDVTNLNGVADKAVDVAMMIRLTRWLTPEQCMMALNELQRVARKRIIFTARVRNHPHARGYDLILSALNGWGIVRDEATAGDEDNRMIVLEPLP